MRVASVPASHVYVRHLSDPDGVDDVVRLDDPVPADGRKVPGGWWPPLMLEAGWVDEHYDSFDVFHLHFGFDAIGADALSEVMGELKRHDKPFVYTVHDLRNPHHLDPQAHNDQQVSCRTALTSIAGRRARAAARCCVSAGSLRKRRHIWPSRQPGARGGHWCLPVRSRISGTSTGRCGRIWTTTFDMPVIYTRGDWRLWWAARLQRS